MNANEALEQVRALAEEWRYKGEFGWDDGSHAYGPDQAGQVLDDASAKLRAILDAVTQDAAVTVETVEELKALPSRAAVMDKLGDVGVLGVGGIYYPETAPVSLEYAVKHWGPFTVLTPATAQSGAES